MHHSQSAPETSGLEFLSCDVKRRETRSQSVPLNLNVVQISKKIVDISDRFNEKQTGVIRRRSRASSEAESLRSNLPKRQSDLVEQWIYSTKPKTNIGSAV